jgi:CheY-like chemotaxis protein
MRRQDPCETAVRPADLSNDEAPHTMFVDDALASEQPMVLVASADSRTRVAIARIVAHHGLTSLIVLDDSAALIAARDYQRSLVGAVLDARLPVLSGWELARALQARAAGLPIAVLDSQPSAPLGCTSAQIVTIAADTVSGLNTYLSCLTESLTVAGHLP